MKAKTGISLLTTHDALLLNLILKVSKNLLTLLMNSKKKKHRLSNMKAEGRVLKKENLKKIILLKALNNREEQEIIITEIMGKIITIEETNKKEVDTIPKTITMPTTSPISIMTEEMNNSDIETLLVAIKEKTDKIKIDSSGKEEGIKIDTQIIKEEGKGWEIIIMKEDQDLLDLLQDKIKGIQSTIIITTNTTTTTNEWMEEK